MAVRSNRQILTQGQKYVDKKARKFGADEVTFDKDSRLDFLTGFHKRKLQRQKKAQDFVKEQERLAKIEERKKIREERKQQLESQMQQFKENFGIQQEEPEEVEEEWNGFSSDEEKDNDDVKPILKKQATTVFTDDTVVEVETLEPNDNFEYIAKLNNVKLEENNKILKESITRATKYAKFLGMADEEDSAKRQKKKKKFRYLTKNERRINQKKADMNKRRK